MFFDANRLLRRNADPSIYKKSSIVLLTSCPLFIDLQLMKIVYNQHCLSLIRSYISIFIVETTTYLMSSLINVHITINNNGNGTIDFKKINLGQTKPTKPNERNKKSFLGSAKKIAAFCTLLGILVKILLIVLKFFSH
jgi:hypothetical protein